MRHYEEIQCKWCRDEFTPTGTSNRFCTAACALYESINHNMDLGSNCWEAKLTDKNGYGVVTFGRKHYLAHRLMWLLENPGRRPPAFIYRTCDNLACCNPAHFKASQPVQARKAKSRLSPRTGT